MGQELNMKINQDRSVCKQSTEPLTVARDGTKQVFCLQCSAVLVSATILNRRWRSQTVSHDNAQAVQQLLLLLTSRLFIAMNYCSSWLQEKGSFESNTLEGQHKKTRKTKKQTEEEKAYFGKTKAHEKHKTKPTKAIQQASHARTHAVVDLRTKF